jgi:hypothetical protein
MSIAVNGARSAVRWIGSRYASRSAYKNDVNRRTAILRSRIITAGQFADELQQLEFLKQIIIEEAIIEAIITMSNEPANPGQEAAFVKYVIPAFESIDTDPDSADPEIVYSEIPGEYLEFMGGIVDLGVEIIRTALESIEEINEQIEELEFSLDEGD